MNVTEKKIFNIPVTALAMIATPLFIVVLPVTFFILMHKYAADPMKNIGVFLSLMGPLTGLIIFILSCLLSMIGYMVVHKITSLSDDHPPQD